MAGNRQNFWFDQKCSNHPPPPAFISKLAGTPGNAKKNSPAQSAARIIFGASFGRVSKKKSVWKRGFWVFSNSQKKSELNNQTFKVCSIKFLHQISHYHSVNFIAPWLCGESKAWQWLFWLPKDSIWLNRRMWCQNVKSWVMKRWAISHHFWPFYSF